jgi:4-hydroxybenzoate polyprenyltransferase
MPTAVSDESGRPNAADSAAPLVVDLDGTLTYTDTLTEVSVRLIKSAPLSIFLFPWYLLKGRAAFKAFVGSRQTLDPRTIPYRDELLEYLRAQRQRGRRTILATAANRSVAESVAAHLGLFDQVLASDQSTNLKGKVKLAAIRREVGEPFTYAGDSAADLPIWRAAATAIVVDCPPRVTRAIGNSAVIERTFAGKSKLQKLLAWVSLLRLHQWVKNLLIFVPLVTSFQFLNLGKVAALVQGFLAFSLVASATYVANDIWDLKSDRAHPRKRNRAIASGSVSIVAGALGALLLLVAGLALAWFDSRPFAGVLIVYLALTIAYSWALKALVLLDVLMLSLLFALRILAGSVLASAPVSTWLFGFSVFMFISLALVKRAAELVTLEQLGVPATKGRDYRVTDLKILLPLGVGTSLSAIVVFCLFISAPDTQVRYRSPELLWLVAFGMVYWTARLWVKVSRGEMHDDPIVYAATDLNSRLMILGMMGLVLLAHFVSISTWFG